VDGVAPTLEERRVLVDRAERDRARASALQGGGGGLGTDADALAFDRDPTSTAARRSYNSGSDDWR